MDTKSLEVLGIGPLRDRSFLVYFSDRTYATVSSEELAKHFPDRQVVPESVTEDMFSGPGYHASRAASAGQLFLRVH
jgi:hypothetical protein